jgi:hypothetical protein
MTSIKEYLNKEVSISIETIISVLVMAVAGGMLAGVWSLFIY